MTQPKWHSFVEAWASTLIGFVISWITTILVFPIFGWPITMGKSFSITCVFTVMSVVRGYFVRRWFNAMLHRQLEKLNENR